MVIWWSQEADVRAIAIPPCPSILRPATRSQTGERKRRKVLEFGKDEVFNPVDSVW